MVVPTRVLFFGTCLLNSFAPRAGLAAMQLLRQAGVQVIYRPDQTCCGQPACNAGYLDEARRVALTQIRALAGTEPVVTPSASCAAMFQLDYPRLFDNRAEAAEARDLAARTVELCAFLDRELHLHPRDHGPPIRVALHNSCSARRRLGVADSAVALLARLDHVSLHEPARATECCGFGGSFSVKQPDLSAAMVVDKADAILATGAEVMVSQDPGCLLNLDGRLRRLGADIEVLHVAEFLWRRVSPAPNSRLSFGTRS